MFDSRLYREACRELCAPEEKVEEIVTMSQQNHTKSRRPVRAVLIAAAAAMMAVGVSAANPQTVQELFFQIATVIQVDEFRQEMTTEDGEQVTVFHTPEVHVENRAGRALLVVNGEETDITDALLQDGRYVYEQTTEGGDNAFHYRDRQPGEMGDGGLHVRGGGGDLLLRCHQRGLVADARHCP